MTSFLWILLSATVIGVALAFALAVTRRNRGPIDEGNLWSWNSGMAAGSFQEDSLNASAGFDAIRLDREEFEENERLHEARRARERRARRWRWLPWSKYRGRTIRAMRWRIEQLKSQLREALEGPRARYWGLKPTDPTWTDDVIEDVIDHNAAFDDGHPAADADTGWHL